MTNEEYASLIAGFSPTVQKDTLQEKIDKLNERTPAKIERVTVRPGNATELGYTPDVLQGMYDADTVITQNLNTTPGSQKSSREKDPYGARYDAVETKHGNTPYDIQGLSKEVIDAGTIGKSTYAMQMQRQQVANVFGKPVEQVTEQDMIDVANQQQVQKLADLARVPGEERWIAPLAIGSAPINLTGSYVDEFGVKQDSSLNVPILSKKLDDIGKRGGVALGNLANEEVTAQAALDPLQNAFAPGAEVARINARLAELEKGPTEKSFLDQLISLPQAFAAGAGKSAYDTVDVYTEIVGDVAGGAVGLVSDKYGKAIDKWVDLGTEEEKTKRINAMVGYDNRFTANNMEKLGKEWDAAVKDVEFLSPSTWGKLNTGKLAEAAKIAFSDIETAAYSLGYIAPALVGAFGKTGAKLAGGVVKKHYDDTAANLKAVATGKMTEEAAKDAARESLEAMSKIDRTKLFLVNNADALQYGAMMNNDQMDEYIKNNGGEDATLLRNILGTAANAAGMKLDIGVMNSILKPSKGTAEVVGDFLKGAGESGSRVLIGKMAELGTKAAIAGLHEMPQEWGQTFVEAFNKIYGTKDKTGKEVGVQDAVTKASREAAVGALAGLAGGAHTSLGVHGTVEAAKAIPEVLRAGAGAVKKGIELATETPEQKIVRQNVEYSTPLKNEAMFAALSGNAAEVADRAEKVHGKLSAELDASAPKSHTYGKILKDALAVAEKAGDETAINNVYKTIAALDKDETVEFNAKDMVNESAYAKTQELIRLINQNTDTADGKMQKLKGEVTGEISQNAGAVAKNAEILALQNQVITEKRKYGLIMGTDEMDPMLEPLTKVEETAKAYLAGTKTLEDVNKEFAELGFMDTDGKADPSRPGLATYEKELTDQMLNTKKNKHLLEVKEGTNVVRLTGLTKFAQSRLNKLKAKATKDSYQTPAMIKGVKAENEKMLKTILNVLKVAKGLKNVDEATRKSYEDELATAANAAIESSKELDRRNDILKTAVKPEGVAGALAFQVDAKGESIQAVTYKDGKPVKVKVADVVGEKAVPIDATATTTNTKVNSDSKTQEVVEETSKEKIAEVLSKFYKLIKIELHSDGDWDYSAMTRNAKELGLLKGAQIVYKYSKGNEKKEAVGTIVGAGKGAKVKIAVGKNQLELEINVWDINKLKKAPIDKDTETKVEVVEPVVEVKKPVETVVEPTKVEVIEEPNDSKIATKKSFEVKARVLTKPEIIETVIDGKVETTKKGEIGDYVLTGPKGEEYTVDAKKVKDRYTEKVNSDGTLVLQTKPVDIKYSVANKDFTFTASWGEQMIAEVGDALVYEDGKLSYRIEKEIFKDTYSPKVEVAKEQEVTKEAFQKFSESVDEIANRPEEIEETTSVEPKSALKKVHKSLQGVIIMGNSGIGKSYAKKLYENIVDGDDLFVQAVNTILLKYGQQASSIDSVRKMRDVFTLWGQYGKDEVKKIEAIKRRDEVYAEYARLAKTAADEGKTVLSSSARPDILKNAKIAIIQTDPETIAKNRASSLRDNQEEFNLEEANNKIKSFKEKVKDLQQIELSPGMYISDILSTGIPTVKGPLATVRASIAKVDAGLSELIAGVEDMDVKRHVKEHYAKKLGEIQADKTRLGKMIDRLEAVMAKRLDRKYDEKSGNIITALVSQIDSLVKSMLTQLARLEKMLKKASKQYRTVAWEMNKILAEIDAIEAEHLSEPEERTIGTVIKIDEKLYGKPVVEVDGKRVAAERQMITKNKVQVLEAPETAINRALKELAKEKIEELDKELKEVEKETGKTSLAIKLVDQLLKNFPMNSPIHKILKRGEDSVFGQLTGNLFADPARLLDVLPKGFKEFFAKDPESKQALLNNFATMAEYIKNTEIGAIVIGKSTKINYKTSTEFNIDDNGLIMKNVTEYVPTKLEDLKIGDRISIENGVVKQASGSITKIVKRKATKATKGPNVGEYGYTKYRIKNIEDGIITATKEIAIKGSIPWTHTIKINQNNSSNEIGVLTKTDNTAAVDVIELLGTVVDGKLQLDEQTQNILKFYSAKMLVDTQKMVGLIQSMDESEMGQVLGIYDAEEQLKVKQDAMEGYINSASVRKDIEGEVYQALGLKFNELAPEFTVESFKSALGILVQAIAIENGSMERKKGEAGGKNQNLIKTNWDTLTVERDALTKAITKLQYLNENRNRLLPGLKKPADDNNRKVMNTENPMDKKSTGFLNKQEKIAYRISPRLARWLAMDEDEVLKAMGYMDVKNAGLHVSEIDAQMARNDKLVREWEILKTFAKSVGDKKFYLKWGQTVSGRFTILNDLNYQESKLHREFVVAEGSTESVDVNDKDARQMLEASILQGLDMDPDKLSPETASDKFNETFKVTDKGIEVVVEGSIKTAYEALIAGKVDAEAMAEVFAESEGHHGISAIELLVAWDEAIKSGKKLETHANLEIDAITSGMILTLLQIGSDVALRMAEKGGIYTAERLPQLKEYVEKWLPGVTFTPGALIEAGKKHAAEIEGKMKTAKGPELVKLRKQLEDDAVFKDLYSTIGVAMIGEVQAYKEKLMGLAKPSQSQLKQLLMLQQIGELNLKNIRSIAKSPVMVYIYGATVGSIKKKLTYSLGVDTLVKALKTASKLIKDGKDASAEMNFINGFLPENEWKFVNEFGAKIEKPTEMWEQLLAVDINGVIDDIGSVINATFGKAIELAFDSRLGFVNKNRDAAKSIEMLVFQAYQIRLADEVQKFLDTKYGIGRHKGESYKLSKEDLQSINQKLTDKGYGHNIVWYEDGKTINQSLNKTDTKGGIHSSKVTVGKTSIGGQIKQFKPAVNTGAAPTISVHAIDGRMMLDVLNREIGGKYTGGNIYDAVVLSVNKAMLTDTADSYNTNMIETGFSRSVIADQLEMLEGMFYIKDEAGNKQFDEDMFNRVLASIGLRPEGELRDDYTKEANRIGLGIGKMLESLVRAEKINGERVTNSGKAYSSGHLYQMGAGVVDIAAAGPRAKQFPVIDTIKRLLQEKIVADRKITHEEFAKAKIKLHKDTDYVANLDDAVKGDTQIQSNANIAQIKTVEGEMTVTDKLWGSLGANDTVQIIASKSSRDWLESEDAEGSPKYWANKMLTEVLKSDAKIVANGFDVKLEESGRVKVDGVWVKKIDEGKADTQEEVGKIGSVQYVQDKIAPWIELDELTKQELAKITDKSALDKIAEDINCRKG